jgi:hypothetical protein
MKEDSIRCSFIFLQTDRNGASRRDTDGIVCSGLVKHHRDTKMKCFDTLCPALFSSKLR